MSSFPGSPRIFKCALVGMNPAIPIPNVILFQYNPETMTRRLEARSTGGGEGSDRSEAFRLTGPPKETITFSAEVDATDQLERADPITTVSGIAPALAALELMLYPKSATILGNTIFAQLGNLEIIPPEAPLSVFVWGRQRVLPVRLTGFSITEEAYDTALNPIRAKLDLSLQVLSTADLQITHRGYSMFMVHQIAKEIMGTANIINSVGALGNALKIF